MHVNRARGKWNFDLFLTKSRKDSLSHLMLQQGLIREFPDVTVERQIQGCRSESRGEPDDWCRFKKKAGYLSDCLFPFIQQQVLHQLRIAGVAYPHRHSIHMP